jgi:hypothetical protein
MSAGRTVKLHSRVSGRCAPADVEAVVLVGPLYLDRTGSLPRSQMAADGAKAKRWARRAPGGEAAGLAQIERRFKGQGAGRCS